MITIVAAVSRNGVIGQGGDMPWRISEDFKHFKRTTTGHPVVMGHNTWLSMRGYPLPDRRNIVISRQKRDLPDGAELVGSLEEAIETAKFSLREIFIIGGFQIYKEALDKGIVDRMILSHINRLYNGDTFFPRFNNFEWDATILSTYEEYDNQPGFKVVEYRKCS